MFGRETELIAAEQELWSAVLFCNTHKTVMV
jgi:hypothetical protein